MAKPSLGLIAVLVNREHSRLYSQGKALERLSQEPYSARNAAWLARLRKTWTAGLAYDRALGNLLKALDDFTCGYESRDPDLDQLHDELLFQVSIYKSAHWAYLRWTVPELQNCLDDFGAVLPRYRDAFKRKYELEGNLPVGDQVRLLKTQYARIERAKAPRPGKATVKARHKAKPGTGKKPGLASRLLGALFGRKGV